MDRLQQLNGELEKKIVLGEGKLESECYRAEAKLRKQWEAREDRLVKQLAKLQFQLMSKEAEREPWQMSKRDVLVKGLHDACTVASADVSMAKQSEFTSSPSLTKTKFPVTDYFRQQQLMQSERVMGEIFQSDMYSFHSELRSTSVIY